MSEEYKTVVLDESILDIESWLPQSAIDEVVQAIINMKLDLNKKITNSKTPNGLQCLNAQVTYPRKLFYIITE